MLFRSHFLKSKLRSFCHAEAHQQCPNFRPKGQAHHHNHTGQPNRRSPTANSSPRNSKSKRLPREATCFFPSHEQTQLAPTSWSPCKHVVQHHQPLFPVPRLQPCTPQGAAPYAHLLSVVPDSPYLRKTSPTFCHSKHQHVFCTGLVEATTCPCQLLLCPLARLVHQLVGKPQLLATHPAYQAVCMALPQRQLPMLSVTYRHTLQTHLEQFTPQLPSLQLSL